MTREEILEIINTTKDFSNIAPNEFIKANLLGLDFSDSNITAEQWLSSRYVRGSKLPQSVDFNEIIDDDFVDKDFYGVDFRQTNIEVNNGYWQKMYVRLNYQAV